MGDDNVEAYLWMMAFNYPGGDSYILGEGASLIPGVGVPQVPNVNATWYTSTTKNLGIDLSLWNAALTVEFDLFRRDRDGNVVVTRLNEQMCQEIAQAGDGIYVRVDNSNAAQKVIAQEINKMAKADVETQVYTEFNEQFQAVAWIILLLLLAEMLILERKNPLFRNIHLFKKEERYDDEK